ncbi:TPA: antirestriction protein ArdR [Salmonella enterica]|uniref:antirestriction protein ArdR n=1 Tax=Salmonella enterica TaxID=28901 RepID=UPI002A5709C4|nr:antirestriction protein ArdR [Salmonella enterica]ECO4189891.1 antirestriction protein ArdR [Salmonella enterica]EKC9955762.1 antirestriction protein ArdR [Salmonella enterica]
MKNYQKIAQVWRNNQDAEHYQKTGVVLIWDGEVYGWKDKLRDAQHERPGVVAVDTDGCVFVTEGGNDYDGASCWVVSGD